MLGAVRHGIVINQVPIEGRQLALVSTSERKQVRVGQSSGRQHTGGVDVFPSSKLTSSGQKVCPAWAGRCTTSGETADGKPIVFMYFGFQII